MSNEKTLEIDKEGSFFRWQEILKVEDKVIPHPTAGSPSAGIIPGITITDLLRTHIGKTARITVEIKNEV